MAENTWVTRAITPISEAITVRISGRGRPCRIVFKTKNKVRSRAPLGYISLVSLTLELEINGFQKIIRALRIHGISNLVVEQYPEYPVEPCEKQSQTLPFSNESKFSHEPK